MNNSVHKKIYKAVLDTLSPSPMTHRSLIEKTAKRLYGNVIDDGQVGEFTEVRGLIGAVISEMKNDGVILFENDVYSVGARSPLSFRMENCEKDILELLGKNPQTKPQIRIYLQKLYKTSATPSESDDKILFNYLGQVLRRMIAEHKIVLAEGKYHLREETRANIEDISSMLELRAAFLSRIHSKGGEFFEHYIMTLLKKHQKKSGKKVIECRTTGGSADGGIDGIMKTIDSLGFRETTMIQAKNRTDLTAETTVRGFYGAVCAMGGSRGILATTSDLHPSAKIFLSNIDNCVGLVGEDIFQIACECLYGIKKKSGKLIIDKKIL